MYLSADPEIEVPGARQTIRNDRGAGGVLSSRSERDRSLPVRAFKEHGAPRCPHAARARQHAGVRKCRCRRPLTASVCQAARPEGLTLRRHRSTVVVRDRGQPGGAIEVGFIDGQISRPASPAAASNRPCQTYRRSHKEGLCAAKDRWPGARSIEHGAR